MGQSQLKILLAEDNRSNIELMRFIIQRLGHHLEIVDDGRKALEKCSTKNFDIVLMDLQMPEMDGIEATRQIRNTNDFNREELCIIALTASNMYEEYSNYKELGFNSFITKPFQMNEIRESLDEACGR